MFRFKQYIKMFLQNVLLPLIYGFYSRKPVERGCIVFADGHHEELPFSMRRMYEELKSRGREPQLFVRDFGKLSFLELAVFLVKFMKRYATAEYVFICDYFLPASSCRKRWETTLVQLWHSCGLMKRIAFDAGDDIPKNYRGDLFGNYSLLTMSAEVCVPVHARALRLSRDRIRATGISRTDYYFDREWMEGCRERFFQKYPGAKGKRIVLWAPTFRGNAAHPTQTGMEAVQEAARELGDGWYLIIKAHPHVDSHGRVSNCELPTEELLAAADVLVTDYSSVLFDYLICRKPAVLFAPDLEEYEKNRGFYLDYRSIPFPVVQDGKRLADAVKNCGEVTEEVQARREAFVREYTGACDGRATERILGILGL